MRFPKLPNTRDPRNYQIATLTALLVYGLTALDLEVSAIAAAVILTVASATQLACTRLWKLPAFDPRSALISGLSLCLLLRTGAPELAALTAAVAISSKFVLRTDNRHIFNPTNFALAVMMLGTDGVWVSPGQWGSGAYFGFLMACIGGLVIHRAARSDVTYAFIGFYAVLVVGRALWLGDPLTIPFHHLQNGAFLLFAFFMISDPKTTPDSRAGRILFALIVALGGAFVHFALFQPNGFIWSLPLASITTPLLNRLFPGTRYEWTQPTSDTVAGNIPERSFA